MDGTSTNLAREFFLNIDWEVAYAVLGALGTAVYGKVRTILKKGKLISLVASRTNSKQKPVIAMSVSSHECDVLGKKRDMLVLDEARPFFSIIDLLNANSIRVNIIQSDSSTNMDEIHVGGPVANVHTNRIFCQYFRDIKWTVTESHLTQYQSDSRLKKFNFSYLQTADAHEGFVIGDRFYQYVKGQEGWAIIARINANEEISPKIVHLLFGCGTNGTIGSVNYFVQNYENIAKRFRNKENYLGIFKVDREGNMLGQIEWLDAEKFIRR